MSDMPTPIDMVAVSEAEREITETYANSTHQDEIDERDSMLHAIREFGRRFRRLKPSAPAARRMIRVEPDGTETVIEPGMKGDIET